MRGCYKKYSVSDLPEAGILLVIGNDFSGKHVYVT